jgi:hypothetical protein
VDIKLIIDGEEIMPYKVRGLSYHVESIEVSSGDPWVRHESLPVEHDWVRVELMDGTIIFARSLERNRREFGTECYNLKRVTDPLELRQLQQRWRESLKEQRVLYGNL